MAATQPHSPEALRRENCAIACRRRAATANVSITNIADAGFGQVEATLLDALANPQRFRGGALTSAATKWNIVDATATTVRLQTNGGAVPAAGAATLAGPDPAHLEGAWQAAGEPVESAGSSTRLQVWAPTPYAMFRYNELDTISGLDAFDPDYACGPTPVEQPVCTRFEDLPVGRARRHISSRPASAAPTMAR